MTSCVSMVNQHQQWRREDCRNEGDEGGKETKKTKREIMDKSGRVIQDGLERSKFKQWL